VGIAAKQTEAGTITVPASEFCCFNRKQLMVVILLHFLYYVTALEQHV
jgi:hypothetical protein